MPPSSRIPPLLQPYTRLPKDDTITLLTSTLGASANWLVIRFLCDALTSQQDGRGHVGETSIVLVSWMQEYEFWKAEARKGAGVDLDRARRDGRFAFVDGLSELFTLEEEDVKATQGTSNISPGTQGIDTARGARNLPMRSPQTLPARGPPGRIAPARGPTAPASTATTTETCNPAAPAAAPGTKTPAGSSNANVSGHYTLQSPGLAHLRSTLHTALSHLQPKAQPQTPRQTLLILDNPDILLSLAPGITPAALASTCLTLHTQTAHLLLHLQADTPLLSLSAPPQPLEGSQYNFLVKMAHASRRIIGVRVLDTGVARDISGVVRVTGKGSFGTMAGLGMGGGAEEEREEEGLWGENGQGREFLYQVKGDGSVRVFERGAGG